MLMLVCVVVREAVEVMVCVCLCVCALRQSSGTLRDSQHHNNIASIPLVGGTFKVHTSTPSPTLLSFLSHSLPDSLTLQYAHFPLFPSLSLSLSLSLVLTNSLRTFSPPPPSDSRHSPAFQLGHDLRLRSLGKLCGLRRIGQHLLHLQPQDAGGKRASEQGAPGTHWLPLLLPFP